MGANMEKRSLEEIRIAEKVRKQRLFRRMTLKTVAEKTGLSTALLSQIENNIVSPPIATLLKISKALGVKISYFFEEDEEDEKAFIYTSQANRETVYRSGTEYGYSYQLLAHGKKDKSMEPFYVRFSRRKHQGRTFFRHEGEEFLFILSGAVEYTIGKEKILLHEGDSLYFDSIVPHRAVCIGEEPAEAIAVVFSGSGSARG